MLQILNRCIGVDFCDAYNALQERDRPLYINQQDQCLGDFAVSWSDQKKMGRIGWDMQKLCYLSVAIFFVVYLMRFKKRFFD